MAPGPLTGRGNSAGGPAGGGVGPRRRAARGCRIVPDPPSPVGPAGARTHARIGLPAPAAPRACAGTLGEDRPKGLNVHFLRSGRP